MTSLWILIKGFSIIGVSAFGGGATMIKLIQETFVEKYNIVDAVEKLALFVMIKTIK